jgi:hypothetical protein
VWEGVEVEMEEMDVMAHESVVSLSNGVIGAIFLI